MGYLSTVNIVDAEVVIDDRRLDRLWRMPSSRISLTRNTVGIRATGAFVLDVEGTPARIDVTGTYQSAKGAADVIVNFANISPAAFSGVYYELGPLSSFDLPVAGTVTVGLDVGSGVRTVGFNLKGGAGTLSLPAPVAQSVEVERVVLRGSFDTATGDVVLDAVEGTMAGEGRIALPAPVDHAFVVKTLKGKARYVGATHRLTVENVALDLDYGAAVSASIIADGFGAADSPLSVELRGRMTDVPVDRLAEFWPATMGTDAHAWVTRHLSNGKMNAAEVAVKLWGQPDALELVEVTGTMRATGVSVDYLSPMPPVDGVDASMVFDERRFDILIERGRGAGLTVTGGTVKLTGLDEYDQYADIDIAVTGPLNEALALIDHEPLGFARKLDIAPKPGGAMSTSTYGSSSSWKRISPSMTCRSMPTRV